MELSTGTSGNALKREDICLEQGRHAWVICCRFRNGRKMCFWLKQDEKNCEESMYAAER